ncbi:hypothetical protein AB0I44_11765, partial [Streptomyces sp. NPDC050600]
EKVSGLPRTVELTVPEVRTALDEPVEAIIGPVPVSPVTVRRPSNRPSGGPRRRGCGGRPMRKPAGLGQGCS